MKLEELIKKVEKLNKLQEEFDLILKNPESERVIVYLYIEDEYYQDFVCSNTKEMKKFLSTYTKKFQEELLSCDGVFNGNSLKFKEFKVYVSKTYIQDYQWKLRIKLYEQELD